MWERTEKLAKVLKRLRKIEAANKLPNCAIAVS